MSDNNRKIWRRADDCLACNEPVCISEALPAMEAIAVLTAIAKAKRAAHAAPTTAAGGGGGASASHSLPTVHVLDRIPEGWRLVSSNLDNLEAYAASTDLEVHLISHDGDTLAVYSLCSATSLTSQNIAGLNRRDNYGARGALPPHCTCDVAEHDVPETWEAENALAEGEDWLLRQAE